MERWHISNKIRSVFIKAFGTGRAIFLLALCLSLNGCTYPSLSDESGDIVSLDSSLSFDISMVDEYEGVPYCIVNDNVPFFSEDEITNESFEHYSSLDSLGRCGTAFACVGIDLMPSEKRGDIGAVHPSGWQTKNYGKLVDGNYLYNRCHLIAYSIAGENANEKNLITGTRYMNTTGMLPFEELVREYVKETKNHVMYRVSPIFEGKNLVASGVLMEAYSSGDMGEDLCFCVYCYNVQPGIDIDYLTGDSKENGEKIENVSYESPVNRGTYSTYDEYDYDFSREDAAYSSGKFSAKADTTYVLNTNTLKFHLPSCSSVDEMSPSNRKETSKSRKELIREGYEPCGRCNP